MLHLLLTTWFLLCSGGTGVQSPVSVDSPAVDQIIESAFPEDGPGCAVGIYVGGEIVYERGRGMANLEHGVPIGPETVFRVASTSKQFTASCIALLHVEGTLDLDASVRTWVPELPDFADGVTVRHLVHHTSGLRDYLTLAALAGIQHDNFDTAFVLDLLSRQRSLNFPPGSEEAYSNTNYLLLGVIVERLTGMSLRDFAANRFFEPLEMEQTHFHDDHTQLVAHRAQGYARGESGDLIVSETDLELVGDGGVFTTVRDLRQWNRAFTDGESMSEALSELMHTTGTLNDGSSIDYAFGLVVSEHRGVTLVQHGGAFAGYRAEFIRVPEFKLGVACLCNSAEADPTSLAMSILEVCLATSLSAPAPEIWEQEPERPKTIELTDEIRERFIDDYYESTLGVPMEIAASGPDMVMRINNLQFPLEVVSDDQLVTFEGPIRLDITRRGLTSGGWVVDLAVPGQGVYHFVHREIVELTPDELREFAGEYEVPELGCMYRIWAGDAGLMIRVGSQDPVYLEVVSRDTFSSEAGGILEFRRDDGVVTGGVMHAGRVLGIELKRVGDDPLSDRVPRR